MKVDAPPSLSDSAQKAFQIDLLPTAGLRNKYVCCVISLLFLLVIFLPSFIFTAESRISAKKTMLRLAGLFLFHEQQLETCEQ